MINSKKKGFTNVKGFTIVELVIVIAVVAILAAVLIPTFSNLVKKANLSADQQAVRQMNTALAIYAAENEKPTNAADAKKALDSQLINVEGGLVPVSKGYAFYWDSNKNEVILVAYGEIIKEGWEILTTNSFGKILKVSSKDDLLSALSSNEPVSITLTNDMTLDEEPLVATGAQSSIDTMNEVSTGEVIEIDLNGKTLNFGSSNLAESAFFVTGGNLIIKNGKITANGTKQLLKNRGGTLVLKNVIIEDQSSQCTISTEGISDTSITNCTIKASACAITSNSSSNSHDGVRVSIIDSEIYSDNATAILINIIADITIDRCKVYGETQGMFLRGNNAVIKNSTFSCEDDPNDSTSDYYDTFVSSGNCGPIAAVTLHAGGAYGGDATFNYVFENVTADTIVAGTTENGKIIVSGVNLTRTVIGSNVTVK